jgi:hypothetical protein
MVVDTVTTVWRLSVEDGMPLISTPVDNNERMPTAASINVSVRFDWGNVPGSYAHSQYVVVAL